MADKSIQMQDPKTGENVYPITITDNIYLPNGTPLMKYLNSLPFPLGILIHSTKILKNAGLHMADGGELMIGGVYDDFCQYVINNQDEFSILYDDGEDVPAEQRKTALQKWQEEFATYGQCGKYVITPTYIKLPAITKFTEGLVNTEMSKLGKSFEAGLPQHTHNYTFRYRDPGYSSGSYNGTGSGSWFNYHSENGTTGDASNGVYGKSDTVQPQSTKYPYYIVVATVTKTDIEVNIDNVVTELNNLVTETYNKANKDLSNVEQQQINGNGTFVGNDRVVETYVNGATWYRKWASGWKETGGWTGTGSKASSYAIAFPNITFSNTNYTLVLSNVGLTSTQSYEAGYTSKSTTGFNFRGTESATNANNNVHWYACGY